MDLQRVRALRGPNLWSRHTAIEAVIYCEEDERSIKGLVDFEIYPHYEDHLYGQIKKLYKGKKLYLLKK